MLQGWRPILFAWSDTNGTLLEATGQTIRLVDTRDNYEGYIGASRHWIRVIAIARDISADVINIRFYNSGSGNVEKLSWEELYANLGISYETAIYNTDNEFIRTGIYNSWLSGFTHP